MSVLKVEYWVVLVSSISNFLVVKFLMQICKWMKKENTYLQQFSFNAMYFSKSLENSKSALV